MFHAAIEVEFGPHWADLQLVGLTGVSILATTILGLIAWWNGHRATVIAQDASERDEARIAAETQRRLASMRREAALAIVLALNAARTFSDTPLRHWVPGPHLEANPAYDEADKVAKSTHATALALIALLPVELGARRFGEWFEHISAHVYGFFDDEHPDVPAGEAALDQIFARLSVWSADGKHLDALLSTDFKGPLRAGADADICQANWASV